MRTYLSLLFMLNLLIVSCTSRVEYQPTPIAGLSPDAVNINTATVEELTRLPHIGQKTAQAIIKFRTENGPFRRAEQLMQMRGMSESHFDDLRPYIRTE